MLEILSGVNVLGRGQVIHITDAKAVICGAFYVMIHAES